MDFEAILSKIMEMAGPMIQMAVELCMELVKGLMSGMTGEGGGPSAKAGVAAALIGGAAMVGGAPVDPNATVPANTQAVVQPAALSAPAPILNRALSDRPATGSRISRAAGSEWANTTLVPSLKEDE